MEDNVAIRVSGVSKRYEIGKAKDGSLRGTLSSLFKSGAAQKDEFWALKDVSFEVKKGEVIGIIGKNGAGKSTLLKILSQITKPTEGRIEINGRVASLLEVGTGFHPELTGRENVFLNGTILGMTRKEVEDKFDEIVAFSGVEKFIDTPVKHYSSGMYVRLAFAVAAHLEPEILIIDEVLAVGDAEFQKKCLGKMKDVAGEGRTVLFVSHNMAAVRELCERGLWLRDGKIFEQGEIDKLVSAYNGSFEIENIVRDGRFDINFKNVRITSSTKEVNVVTHNENFVIHGELVINSGIMKDTMFCLSMENTNGVRVFSVLKELSSKGIYRFHLPITNGELVAGRYNLILQVFKDNGHYFYNETRFNGIINILNTDPLFKNFEGYGYFFPSQELNLLKL